MPYRTGKTSLVRQLESHTVDGRRLQLELEAGAKDWADQSMA